MHSVAPLITKIDFAVLNDRVVPVGDLQRTVGTHPGIDRTKGDVIDLNRFAEIGIGRLQVHRRVVSDLHRSHFRDRIGFGNVGQVTLSKHNERADGIGNMFAAIAVAVRTTKKIGELDRMGVGQNRRRGDCAVMRKSANRQTASKHIE